MDNPAGNLKEEVFIVSNHRISTMEKQKLENRKSVRVKAILYSEGSSPRPDLREYSTIILEVGHQEFKTWDIQKLGKQVVFDVKSVLNKELVDSRHK